MSQQAQRGAAPEVNQENPWPGLASFTEEQRAYFFGREEETAELLRRVRGKVLTVLFGQSGLGKTSLVNAGLSPRLREEDMIPIVVRLNHDPAAPAGEGEGGGGLADQVRAAIRQTIAQKLLDAPAPGSKQTLWEYFHQRGLELWTPRNRPATVVLVFDQFEEIYTLGRSTELTRQRGRLFAAELADLIENRPPAALRAADEETADAALRFDFGPAPCKVLLSLREDYLPDLEGFRKQAPSLAENRQRLQLMNGRQALHVLCGAGGKLIDRATAIKVVRFVGGANQVAENPADEEAALEGLSVEPALLSIFAQELNRKRQTQGLARITADLLEGQRDQIITDFYERSLGDLPAAVRPFIEDRLLTPSGYRDSLAMEIATGPGGLAAGVIDQLVARRLLHVDQRLGSQRLELTHDVLTGPVRASRTARLQGQAVLQARERERAVRAQLRRARQRLMVASALAVAMLGLAVFSYLSWRQAQAAAVRAEQERAAAERSANLAKSSIEHTLMKLEWDEAVAVVGSMSSDASAGNTAEILQGLADKYVAEGKRTEEIRARLWLAHVQAGAAQDWIQKNADELTTLVLGLMAQTDEGNWPKLEEFFSPACPVICECISRRLPELAGKSSAAQRRSAVALGQFAHAPLWFAGRSAPQAWLTANADNLKKIMLDVMANEDQGRWKDAVEFFAPAYAIILGRITDGIGELVDAEDVDGKQLDAAVSFGARQAGGAAGAPGAGQSTVRSQTAGDVSLGNPVQRAIDNYKRSKSNVPEPDPGMVLGRGGGAFTDRFAFCQNLPLSDARQAAAILRKKNYQLRSFRPYAAPDGRLLVTARWENGGPESLLQLDLTQTQVRDQERTMWQDGYIPDDLTWYETTAENGQRQERFALVWHKADRVAPRYELYLAVPKDDFASHTEKAIGAEFHVVTAQVVVGADGAYRFYGIATTDPSYQTAFSRWKVDFRGLTEQPTEGDAEVLLDARPQTEQAIDLTQYWQRVLALDEAQLQTDPQDQKTALEKGQALLHLGRLAESLAVFSGKPLEPPAAGAGGGGGGEALLYWRVICKARLGDGEGAQADYKALAALRDPGVASMVYLRGVMAVCAGQAVPEEVAKMAGSTVAGELYNAACVYGWAAGMTQRSAAEREQLAGRALEILRLAVQKGYGDGEGTWTDSDLLAVRGRPEFAALMAEIPPQYIETCLTVPRGVPLAGVATLQTGTASELVQGAAAHAQAGDTLTAVTSVAGGGQAAAVWAPRDKARVAAVMSARITDYQKTLRGNLRQSLQYEAASDAGKKWWDNDVEQDYAANTAYLLNIMQALDQRHSTIEEFYRGWCSAKSFYLWADLYYLDYLRSRKTFAEGLKANPPRDRYAGFVAWMGQKPLVRVTDVSAMTADQIAALVEKKKVELEFDKASADARTWWARLEADNVRRPALLLRLLEELATRKSGAACFDGLFEAAADCHTEDLLGQLQYLDYLDLWRGWATKKQSDSEAAPRAAQQTLLETYARHRLLGLAPPVPPVPDIRSADDLDAAIGDWCAALQNFEGENSPDVIFYASSACGATIGKAIEQGVTPDVAAIAQRLSQTVYKAMSDKDIAVILALRLPAVDGLNAAQRDTLTKARASITKAYQDDVFKLIKDNGLDAVIDPAAYKVHDPEQLSQLFEDMRKAYWFDDLGKAGGLLALLTPDEKAVRSVLADDVPADVLRRISAQPARTPDELGQMGLYDHLPDVDVERTSLEHIRTADLTAPIARYLKPGTVFYQVQFDETKPELHLTLPLIFWDGTGWKMLPALWEIAELRAGK